MLAAVVLVSALRERGSGVPGAASCARGVARPDRSWQVLEGPGRAHVRGSVTQPSEVHCFSHK